MCKVTIVEDQPAFREALAALVQTMPGFEVLYVYERAEDALTDTDTETDIFLLDINLPGMSGIELVRRLRNSPRRQQFLMCSNYDDDEYVFDALRSGAHGYILKNSSPFEIMHALRDLAAGGAPMSSAIARKVIYNFHAQDNSGVLQLLTQREAEILEMLSKGHIYKEIASRLGISVETVRKHCYTIYEKLHVDNRVEAINKFLGR